MVGNITHRIVLSIDFQLLYILTRLLLLALRSQWSKVACNNSATTAWQ